VADDQTSFILSAEDKASQAINKVTDSLERMAQAAEASAKETNSSLKQIESSTNSLSSTFKDRFSVASQAFASFTGNLAADLAVKSLEFLAETAKKTFDVFVKEGVKAASESEAAFNDLANAMARTGNYSQKAAEDFKSFADAIEKTTGVNDKAVLSAGSLIESLTGLDEKGLKQATKAAIDLSAALGKDLDTAATLVAKSLIGNEEALARVGVSFKGFNKDALNSTTILTELEKRFGGAAAGKINTFAGAVTILSTAFENIQKEIGFIIIKNGSLVAAIKEVSTLFFNLSDAIKESSGSLGKGFTSGLITAIDVIAGITIALNTFAIFAKTQLQVVVEAVRVVSTAFFAFGTVTQTVFEALFKAASGDFKGAFTSLQTGLETVKTNFVDTFKTAGKNIKEAKEGPLTGVVGVLGDIRGAMVQASGKAAELGTSLKNGSKLAKPANDAKDAYEGLLQTLGKLKEESDAVVNKYIGVAQQIQAAADAADSARAERELANNENYFATLDMRLESTMEFLANKLQAEMDALDVEQKLIEDQIARDGVARENQLKAIENIEKRKADTVRKFNIQTRKEEELTAKQKLDNTKSSLDTISGLMREQNGTLFAIGKAAALANATIYGYEAIAKAWAIGGPFGAPLAALVAVATAANIARIAATQPPKFARGITEIPAGFGGDSFPAMLTSGERVVPASSNEDLKAFLSESMGSKEILVQIANRLDRLEHQTVVNIGGREIMNEIRSSISEGRSLQPV
jgi:hypothetical protein